MIIIGGSLNGQRISLLEGITEFSRDKEKYFIYMLDTTSIEGSKGGQIRIAVASTIDLYDAMLELVNKYG